MKMKCNQVQLNVENYLDGELPILQRDAVSGHVKTCESCRAVLTSEEKLRQALRSLPIEEINPEFIEKAMKQARQVHKKPVRRYFMPGFISVVGASLAILFLTTTAVMRTAMVEEDDKFPLITMAINETRTVQMVFDSPDDFKAVNFNIVLPEGFEIAGYPGDKALDWEVNIKKGNNLLELPLVALISGKGELVASIAHVDKTKSFRFHVSSENSNTIIF